MQPTPDRARTGDTVIDAVSGPVDLTSGAAVASTDLAAVALIDDDPALLAPRSSLDEITVPAAADDDPQAPVTARTNARFGPALMWSYVLTTGGNLVGAVLQIGVTAVLGPRSFGVMVLAMTWVSLGLMLLQHGPTMVVIQQDNIDEEHANAAFWVTVVGTVIFTAAFALSAPLLAEANHLPELAAVCWALTPVLLLTGCNVILDSVIRRRLRMRNLAIRNLASSVFSGLCGLAAALAGWGVWALVVQQLVAVGSYTVVLWLVAPWRPGRPQPRRMVRSVREIGKGSVQTLAGALGYFVSTKMDGLLMGMFFTPSAVGSYRFGSRFAEMVLDLTERGLEQVSLAELARYNTDRVRLAERLNRFVHAAAIVSFPALAVLGVAAGPFVAVLGSEWNEAVDPLRVLCMVSAVGVFANMLAPALQAAQRPGLPAVFTWLSAAFYVGGFLSAVHFTGSMSEIGRLTTIALVVLAMRVVVTAAMAGVTYVGVLKCSPWPAFVAILPAVASSAAAVVAGWATLQVIGNGLEAFLALVVTGTIASLAAGATLLALDHVARDGVTRVTRRVRERLARPATHEA